MYTQVVQIAIFLVITSITDSLVLTEPCCTVFEHSASTFGPPNTIEGKVTHFEPLDGCTTSAGDTTRRRASTSPDLKGKIVFIERGSCHFIVKAAHAEAAGACGAVIYNGVENRDLLVTMSATKQNIAQWNVTIPSVMVTRATAHKLLNMTTENGAPVTIKINATGEVVPGDLNINYLATVLWYIALILIQITSVSIFLICCWRLYKHLWRVYREKSLERAVKKLPHHICDPENLSNSTFNTDSCVICIEDFAKGDIIRSLPCHHDFHKDCIDPWLTTKSNSCPICKQEVVKIKSNKKDNAHGGGAAVTERRSTITPEEIDPSVLTTPASHEDTSHSIVIAPTESNLNPEDEAIERTPIHNDIVTDGRSATALRTPATVVLDETATTATEVNIDEMSHGNAAIHVALVVLSAMVMLFLGFIVIWPWLVGVMA